VRYTLHRPDQTPLVMRIRDLAATRTRSGYFRIYILLRRDGWLVNHKALLSLSKGVFTGSDGMMDRAFGSSGPDATSLCHLAVGRTPVR
jgi:hypothetical protein